MENFVAVTGRTLGCVAYSHDTFSIGTSKRRTVLLRALLQAARKGREKTQSPKSGLCFAPIPGVRIEVLHPDDEDLKAAQLSSDPNNASVLIRLSFAGRRVLLPGDLAAKGWECVIERSTDLKADFVRFPHHGAWYHPNAGQPSLPDVLRQIDPEVVVFSVGSDNIYGHPHPNSIALVCSMPRTWFAHTQPTPQSVDHSGRPWPRQFSDRGTVEVVIDATGYRVFVLDSEGKRIEKVLPPSPSNNPRQDACLLVSGRRRSDSTGSGKGEQRISGGKSTS